jgi:hypothetical protein
MTPNSKLIRASVARSYQKHPHPTTGQSHCVLNPPACNWAQMGAMADWRRQTGVAGRGAGWYYERRGGCQPPAEQRQRELSVGKEWQAYE